MRLVQINNYPLYKISDCGKVYSIKANRFLRGDVDRYGYLHYILFNQSGHKHKTAHRLVAIHFVEGNNSLQVNHKDGNTLNNSFENLEWVTAKENVAHSMDKLGRNNKGSKNPSSKINESTALKIKQDLFNGISQHSIAATYGISRSTISMIAINKIWSHIKLNLHGNEKISLPVGNLQENGNGKIW